MQVESEFIPYALGRQPWDARYTPYIPMKIPGMRTVPGKHVRLAKVMYRIGYWFTEKAEDWDDHTFFVTPTQTFKPNYKQPEYIRYEERGKPK